MKKYDINDTCINMAASTDDFIVVTNKGKVCKANYIRCQWVTEEELL